MTGVHASARFSDAKIFFKIVACQSRFSKIIHELFRNRKMLYYSVIFLVIALIAAVFGFGGIAAGAVSIAKILFVIFAIMAVVSFVMSLMRKN